MKKAYLYQRFSAEVQRGNSSEDRQLELQLEWLERNKDKAIKAEDGNMFDDGFSASKGEHIKSGALGRFFEAIDAGFVERGSYLLVENFSRLTRYNITPSEDLVRKLWDADITIVTVSDGMEYTPAHTNDPATRTKLLFEFDRAYREIEWHKKKIAYSYQKRFKDFVEHGTIPKLRRPFWLDKQGKLNKYSDSVKRMFELYSSGNGQVIVSRTLKEEFPDYEPIQKMIPTTVIRIITSDIVRGVWKNVKMFEAAVDDDLYIEANHAHATRLNKHKSSNAKRAWPLSGLFRCGHCKSVRQKNEFSGMSIQQTDNSLPLLRCSNRQRKAGRNAKCAENGEPTTFPYILAHWFFVNVVQKKALEKFSSQNSDAELKKKLKEVNLEITKLQKAMDESQLEYNKLVKSGKAVKFVIGMISQLDEELEKLKTRREELNFELKNINRFIISPEASSLIEDVETFNRTMRELDIKMIIKNRTIYFEDEKGYEYTRYCKKTDTYYYFDHVFMKRECPIPIKPSIEGLLMKKVLSPEEAADPRNIDDSFFLQFFDSSLGT